MTIDSKAAWHIALASALALTIAAALPHPAAAQGVVQSLPPQAAGQINAALRRLAARPTDLEALLDAGRAALTLRDLSAAAGFSTRAAAVAPNDPRVLILEGRVALEQRRPVAALDAFTRAERAGARSAEMAADRALAYDLVGDNATAQALYRGVLAAGNDGEVRRRLALSLAIAGNRAEFERTLFPLLKANDRGAFRTRAFGLAILGSTDEAVGIADAMMPTDLALRMAPYLRYMPRLTKAQQAAAGNLGAFPAAAEIGRDSSDIAGYAATGTRIAAQANTSLTPSGTALGPRAAAPRVQSQGSPPPARPLATPAAPARTGRELAAVTIAPAVNAVAAPVPAPGPAVPAISRPSLADAFAEFGTPAPASAAATATAGAVDIAKLAAAREADTANAAREAAVKAAAARAAKARADKALADKAKAEKAKADAEKAKAERLAKAEPARRWIQVGVGRNTAAFAFDWKRLAKQAGGALDGKGPWAARYGASNRLLAGPYATQAAVDAALKRLRAKDIDALPFSSAQGEAVTRAN